MVWDLLSKKNLYPKLQEWCERVGALGDQLRLKLGTAELNYVSPFPPEFKPVAALSVFHMFISNTEAATALLALKAPP